MGKARSGVTVDEVCSFWKSSSDEVVKSGGDSVRSEHSGHKHLLERSLLESLPVEWKFFILWSELVVPVLEPVWRLLLNMLGKELKSFNLDELLEGVPGKIWQPFLEWIWNISS